MDCYTVGGVDGDLSQTAIWKCASRRLHVATTTRQCSARAHLLLACVNDKGQTLPLADSLTALDNLHYAQAGNRRIGSHAAKL